MIWWNINYSPFFSFLHCIKQLPSLLLSSWWLTLAFCWQKCLNCLELLGEHLFHKRTLKNFAKVLWKFHKIDFLREGKPKISFAHFFKVWRLFSKWAIWSEKKILCKLYYLYNCPLYSKWRKIVKHSSIEDHYMSAAAIVILVSIFFFKFMEKFSEIFMIFNHLSFLMFLIFAKFCSIIGCGVTQVQYAFNNISDKSRTTVKYFIKVIR